MSRHLKASLSESSLASLEAELRSIAGGLDSAAVRVASGVALEAAKTATELCPVETDALRSSIHVEPDGQGRADVVASSKHAAFVEFGTGMGEASRQPLDQEAMNEAGYWPNPSSAPWAYPKSGGGWGITNGQSGVGFMAAGAEQARAKATEIARRAVRL